MAATPSAGVVQSPGPMTSDSTLAGRKRSRTGSRKPSLNGQDANATNAGLTTEQLVIDQWVNRDATWSWSKTQSNTRAHEIAGSINEEIKWYKDFRNATTQDPGRVYGDGFKGFGNGWTAQYPSKIIYPAYRKRPGMRKTPELRIKRNDRIVASEQFEELAPVRLEVEFEKLRLRDTFTWNVYDRTLPPQLFAQGLVEDLQIPPEAAATFIQEVTKTITDQIVDHHPHPFIEEEPLDPHLPYYAYKNDEMRITIKLNITIGQHALVDQFEWDINNKLNSPEEFAARMARDMSLSGEFITAIAHQIREQTQMFTKSLYVTGHPFDGRPVEDPDVKENLLASPLPSTFRAYQAAKEYAPAFFEMSAAELEKQDSALSREQRQIKRSVNRRGGPAMPDLKDRYIQTVRTMVISSVIPGAAESVQTSGVYKPARATAGRGRRAGWKTIGDDETDDSEAEESEPDSPVRQVMTGGTARTRGVRGAAAAASAAMRAGYNAGSLTPDTEARTSRRFGRTIEDPEDMVDDGRFLLRIKMPRERFRQWWREYKQGIRRPYPPNFLAASRAATPFGGMPPPSTPGAGNRALGGVYGRPSSTAPSPRTGSRHLSREASMAGSPPPGTTRGSIPPTPQQSQQQPPSSSANNNGHNPPAAPTWLTAALSQLRDQFPQDSIDSTMRWNNVRQEWQPRIKCNDCPGNVYKTDPADPVSNFKVHLENRKHRANVEARVARGG